MVERMAEAVTGFIDGAEPRHRRAWLVTDFITLGSPLAHAPYLMCKGKSAASHRQDFDRRVREFEFPTSPPARANGGGRLTIVDPQTNRRHFHHGAQFGLTRWTNLYFPMSELTSSKNGPPGYADVNRVGAAYVKAAPDRMVWGSNWPHPNETTKPDDALLFDQLAQWAPDERIRNRILVDNPAALYDFPKA